MNSPRRVALDRSHPTVARLLVGGALVVAAGAFAQPSAQNAAGTTPRDAARPSESAAATAPLGDAPPPLEPNVSLALYGWLTSFDGTVGAKGVTTDIDESFFDILDASDTVYGLMGALDVEYRRFVFQLNGAYTHAEFSRQRGTAVGVGLDLGLDLDTLWLEFLGGYRFVDEPFECKSTRLNLSLDGFVGGRVTWLKQDLSIVPDNEVTLRDGRVLGAGTGDSFDQEQSWIEPFVGARTTLRVGEHLTFGLRGDVGGFGVDDSEFSWQALAYAGFGWDLKNWRFDLFAGYRALGQDYSNDGFVWDAITHGPILGARAGFAF